MDIREFLQIKGPNLSSTIKEKLLEEGVKEEAARQQISRARGGIFRLNEIQFPKGEKFIYLKDQYRSPLFNTNLVRAFKITSSVHKCIITGLNNFGGCVSVDKLKVISGCPQARKKKKTFDQVIRELQSIGLIAVDDSFCHLHEDVFLSTKIHTESRVINYLNEFLQAILAIWLKNNSLVSYNSISFCGDFNSYRWDIVAPSYLLPLIKRKDEKTIPGFIIADIIPHYDIDDDDIDYFIRKVESCYMEGNTPLFIPILLGYRFKESSWELLKRKNILAATVNNFFGDEIQKLLTNIINLLETKTIRESDSLDAINDILSEVSKIEGPTNNFKGHFFELVVGFIVCRLHIGSVTLRKKISKDNIYAEIDVLAITDSEIIVYECKGNKPDQLISEDDIKKWEKSIAFIYKYLKNNPENTNRRITFNFWTSSDFSEEANIEFRRIGQSRYTIDKKNGNEILAFSKRQNLEEICAILKQYYVE